MIRVLIPGFGTGPRLFAAWPEKTGCTVLPNAKHSYAETAEHLGRLAQNGRLDLFGWSLGSLFALRWALENPGSVKSLFLTGATARFCEAPGYENGIAQEKLREMARLIIAKREAALRAFFSSFLKDLPEKEGELARMMEDLPGPDTLLSGLAELDGTDLLESLKELKAPLRIVQGEKDMITPLAGAERIVREVPESGLQVLPGGHALFLEEPGRLEEEWVSWTV